MLFEGERREASGVRDSLRGTAVVVLLAAGMALAGAWPQYDDTKGMSLTGVILSWSYEHSRVVLQLDAEKPERKAWTVVLTSRTRMESRGLSVRALEPGVKATVYVYPNRDLPDDCRALRITIGGKTTELW
jgi:hypothetical protein